MYFYYFFFLFRGSSLFFFPFKSISQFSVVNIAHQPSSWSQTSSSRLRTRKCHFYSNGQIMMRTTKITIKDLIFLEHSSALCQRMFCRRIISFTPPNFKVNFASSCLLFLLPAFLPAWKDLLAAADGNSPESY